MEYERLSFTDNDIAQANTILEAILGEIPTDWLAILTLLQENPDELAKDEKYEDSDFVDHLENEETTVSPFLITYLSQRKALTYIDWRGQAYEGHLASYVMKQLKVLTGHEVESTFSTKLLEVSSNETIKQQTEDDESYIGYVFDNINNELKKIGFCLLTINTGWDGLYVFVTQSNNLSELLAIKFVDISIQDAFC